jgi:hypothetical protein
MFSAAAKLKTLTTHYSKVASSGGVLEIRSSLNLNNELRPEKLARIYSAFSLKAQQFISLLCFRSACRQMSFPKLPGGR